MEDEWNPDPELICRDDACARTDVHPRHDVPQPIVAPPKLKKRKPKIHHRPDGSVVALYPDPASLGARPAPRALTNAIARATSKSDPRQFGEIVDRVHNDYGSAPRRSIYRYLALLVERSHVIKLDLGFAFAVYIRPGSKLLGDVEQLRDLILGKSDTITACSKEAV